MAKDELEKKDRAEEPTADPPLDPPSDVAGLYNWANLEASAYRDFSQSRKLIRAEGRDQRRDKTTEPLADQSPRVPVPIAKPPGSGASPAGIADRVAPIRKGARRGPASATVSTQPSASKEVTLQRGGSRWSALKSVFKQGDTAEDVQPLPPVAVEAQVLAFISLVGGVGKTSLTASLGATLAAQGESVLLVDTNLYGLLPLYFGAAESRSEDAATSSSSATDSLIQVMSMEADPEDEHLHRDQWLAERIARHAYGARHVLIDVATASTVLLRQVLRLGPMVIVTLRPDMASIVSLQALRELVEQISAEAGRSIELFYLLNQFDVSLRLHADILTILERQLGARLLPFVIHRSDTYSEALAEGLPLIRYAADSRAQADMENLLRWYRELHEPGVVELSHVRWRES
jgi:chromosome partitioning protein